MLLPPCRMQTLEYRYALQHTSTAIWPCPIHAAVPHQIYCPKRKQFLERDLRATLLILTCMYEGRRTLQRRDRWRNNLAQSQEVNTDRTIAESRGELCVAVSGDAPVLRRCPLRNR